ncbi:papilin isoform X3 [Galleria mellonella]|uniref:Papilin isoform X3 n=1 Tax=Galleria mellonella TaxID=7137 RepID=A0ABM3MYC6_GALME|nr:papilin isoform X3 [Galleria mellonella]
MGLFSLRSLLLAAFILSNCITWTVCRHHYTHNINGHRSRHRRQGAGLFLSASYVLPGGEGTGAWGEWGEVTPCSRTCGGGVASQKRICLEVGPDGQPLCTGGDTKYFSCQTQDCPPDSKDFRSEQCSEYDNISFKGIKYKWVPYLNGPNPCELNCMPRGERFYYRQKAKVTDGTLCNDESLNVCVNGTCQPVGCDRMLGSSAQEDKCLVCRGNGANCRTISGLLDAQDLRKGYNDMLLIPQNATSIVIEEVRDSTNYLAIRAKSGTYYLNGDYHIDFPRSIIIAGAHWHYERNQRGFAAPDKLRCLGPINEPLILSLLLQDENVGIKYEYSIAPELLPLADQQYHWVFDNFTPCTATCGGGFQTRNVTCRSREELDIVDDGLCEEALKPPSNQTCNTDACPAQWIEGPWSPCSKACGEGGSRSRQVQCQKIITNGVNFRFPSIVADKECFDILGPKPELFQECNKNASCPKWFTGPWKPCDKLCGEGKQTRQVVCYQKTDTGRVEVLEDSKCEDKKPDAEQPCSLHPCEGVDWVVSDWTGCDTCISTVRTRAAECATKSREVVDPRQCAYHPAPVLQEPCDRSTLPACEVQWYATQWSKCSADCGKGVQSRRVFCGLFDGSSVLKVNDSRCANQTKYNDTKTCEIPKDKCPAKWYAGPWSECTKVCGGGEQYRRVLCIREDKEVNECDLNTIIDATQSCNTGPCDKDETLPVNASAAPIIDADYEDEDCTEEEEDTEAYEEVGAEEESASTPFTMEDLMFSDSPSTIEGSGWTLSTESGSGEGSGWTEFLTTDTDTNTAESESSTVSSELNTETTESGATDETSESGSTDTTESVETSETGSTETSELSSTDITESGATVTGESESTEESTVSGLTDSSTESSVIDETSETDSTGGTTESGSTAISDLTSDLSSTDTTNDISSTTSSSSTDESTESSTTEESTDITTESGSTDITGSEPTESSTGSDFTSTTNDGSTDSSTDITSETGSSEESSTIEFTGETTESGATTEYGSTGETGSTDSSTDLSTTEFTGSTESTETEITETGSDITDISTTEVSGGSTETEYSTTEGTGSTDTEVTESSSEGYSTTEISTEEWSTESEGSTIWDYSTTMQGKKRVCKRRKSKCKMSKFGCCPDMRTPAAGPFDEGCPNPKTCKESKFGCCPDGVSPAAGPKGQDCPVLPCNETLYGCCQSDHITPAEGNDQEGCPPACKSSKYGCCEDGSTKATGPKKAGCPETEAKRKAAEAKKKAQAEKKKKEEQKRAKCAKSKYGCCPDNSTVASGPKGAGCLCNTTEFGCCPDGVTTADDADKTNCANCNTSAFGCCADGKTPAHGYDNEGCCLLYEHGCCPDNYQPAKGPHFEGCNCKDTRFGCCPDEVTSARGPENEGCGCQFSEFGCCPDGNTPAKGLEFEGCDCHTYQFGCCEDGVTIAKGPNRQGCHCRESKYGCCGDQNTPAIGPNMEGCDCASSKYGCCPDGQTEAKGKKFLGCTDIPESRQAACSLATDRGSCHNYSVYWFYDMEYGGCSRFWYGGCEGNGNRFSTKEECEDVCVQPSPKDACKLPQVKGACAGYLLRWYYDSAREHCSQFVYGGCLGNGNNFESEELCRTQCEPTRAVDQCSLPLDPGSCAGNYIRWGFNPDSGRCEQFTWGGCEGNTNRFSTEAACKHRCDTPGEPKLKDICELPAEIGECADYRQNWYYDTAQKRCLQFYYGGCGGNENNFHSLEQCESRCAEKHPTTTTTTTRQPAHPDTSEFCFLELDPGQCDNFETRWGYDSARGICTTFEYGGCGGNRNNFPNEDYCTYYCITSQDICQLPMMSGPCDQSQMKWFYNPATDSCSRFTYGGCEGNGNRFDTEEDCERRCRTGPAVATPVTTTTTTTIAPAENLPPECRILPTAEECTEAGVVWYLDESRRACVAYENDATGASCRHTGVFASEEACERSCGAFRDIDVCKYPKDPGPCREAISKIYFDAATGSCLDFAYGGCQGGPNRFSSIEECEQICQASETDPCSQPLEVGNCMNSYTYWYYEQQRDACYQFAYSGCNGNDNRFQSREECEGRCRRRPSATPAPPAPPAQPVDRECNIPESLEACGENITAFYYDPSRQECVAAINGGCRLPGTYLTEEDCERRCGTFRGLDAYQICRYPLDVGTCKDSIPKYYWDIRAGKCERYTYGGCGGGPNRFSTIEECENFCEGIGPEPACLEPVDTGSSCSEVPTRRYYYSPVDGECKPLVYRGCGGTNNNFPSYEYCVELCERWKYTDSSENEVEEPEQCTQYEEECARLRCAFSVQRTRTAGGCERCSCVPVEVDCEPLRQECRHLKCTYGLHRYRGHDGCERCQCIDHPCADKQCPEGERCVASAYRDPVTQDMHYSADCKIVNKPGSCPREDSFTTEGACRRECNDDADCRGVGKCCARGCSSLCLEPAAGHALHTTTYSPELPQAPQANTEETEPEVAAQEGGRATLRCLFHGNPPPRITWSHRDITIDGTVGRYRLHSDGALEIVSLYRNDSGVYICVAENIHGSSRQEVHLQVNDPVETSAGIAGEPNSVVTGEIGRSLSIRCLAYGFPEPSVVWYRGSRGTLVPFSSSVYEARGNVLLIRRLDEDVLDKYTCEAYNGVGRPASWSVRVEARSRGLSHLPYTTYDRSSLTTAPPRERTTPPPEITVPVYTVPVKTRISAESTTLAVGSELSLPCEVDGYPVPNVHWTKDGVPLSSDHRTQITEARLTITGLTSADSGAYGCHASNSYSSDSSIVRISVKGIFIPPNCKDNPFFADCHLIVRSKFCGHPYYSKFCCKSCVEAGQLLPQDLDLQSDEAWKK